MKNAIDVRQYRRGNQKWTIQLENTEGAIKNGQSRETGNIEYTERRKHNMCWTDPTIRKQTQIT